MLLSRPNLSATQKTQNGQNRQQLPPPILRPKTQRQEATLDPLQSTPLAINLITPLRGGDPLSGRKIRGLQTLTDEVDYDRLTPTKQAQWDLGIYGTIELKKISRWHYYYLRWYDQNGKRKSTYLAKEWDKAIAKVRRLTGCSEDFDDPKQLELHSFR
jgi:hypothetical protein